MPITYTAGTSVEGTGSVTSTTVTLPAGLAAGDYTIIFVSLNATNGVITTPGGWTNILASTQGTGSTSFAHAIFYRKWVSGDTNPAITTTSGRVAATPVRVEGADGTTFVNTAAGSVTQAAAGATTITAPTKTPTTTNFVCSFGGRRTTNGAFLTPFGTISNSMTKLAEASGKAGAATNAGHCIGVQQVTSGAATGTRSVTPAGAVTGGFGVSFALNAAAGATVNAPAATATADAPVPVVAGNYAPGVVLDIGPGAGQNHFEVQVAPTGAGSPVTYTQADIANGYDEDPYFTTIEGSPNRVQFYARLDAPVVGSSTSSRSELREVDASGNDLAFDALVGTHVLHGRTKITHLPPVKPEVVIAQLHNGDADRIAIRTQLVSGTIRLRCRINGSSVSPDFASPYVVGTEFEWKIEIVDGTANVYYNDMVTPIITSTALVASTHPDAWYFKTGMYNQSNVAAGDVGTEYGSAELRDLTVSHAGPVIVTAPAATATAAAPTPGLQANLPVIGGGTPGTLALDASSPALDSAQATATTTDAFTAPAGSLIVACVMASGGSQANPTVAITNSGTAFSSWTLVDRATQTTSGLGTIGGGVASMHWAVANSSASTTVTATQTSGSSPTWLKVYVITGANTAAPIGDTDMGATKNNAAVTGSMVTTDANSWLLMVGNEWAMGGSGAPTSPDLNIGFTPFEDGVILRGAAGAKLVASSGSSVTGTIDGPGTGSLDWLWVAAEIKRAPGSGSNMTAVATAAAPTPTVAVTSGVNVNAPAALATAAALAPTLQAGATVTAPAATATAAALVPGVTVVANVAGVRGIGSVQAVVPTVSAGATRAAVLATGTAAALAPAVSVVAAITTPAATGTAAALVPAVSAGGTGNVQAVRAIATAAGLAPVVGAGANVAGAAATATATGLAPTVAYGATVVSPVATSTAAALAPFAEGGQPTIVSAPAAQATTAALAPVLHAFATITAPALAVSVQAPTPAFQGSVTILAPAGSGTAQAYPVTVTTVAGVFAPVAAANASAPLPGISYGYTLTAPRAVATAAAVVPQNVQGDKQATVAAVRAIITGQAPAPTAQAYMAVFAQVPTCGVSVATYAPSVGGAALVAPPKAGVTAQAKLVILMGVVRDLSLTASPLSATSTVASLGTRIGAEPITYTVQSGVPLYGPMQTEPLSGRFRIEE